jgi:hypothetical protein
MEAETAGVGEDPAGALSAEQLKGDVQEELGKMANEELKGVNIKVLLAKLSELRAGAAVGRV